MEIDRRVFFGTLGGVGAVELMSHEDRAEALEHYMTAQLDRAQEPETQTVRKGTGNLFRSSKEVLEPMPEQPTLLDFFRLRFAPANHVLQSATHAMKTGQPERTIFSCLVHDVTQNLIRTDHGYWGAQLFEPYVDERVSWGIRYHQALRFYPDPEVGYEYPEMYNRLFGVDYEPDAYIEAAHKFARNHRFYMEARLVTLNDQYSFDPDAKVSVEPFVDIIGRQFKQPKEGLGFDNGPVAHMWRSMMYPDRPL